MLGQVMLKNPRAVVGAAAFAVGVLAYLTKPTRRHKGRKIEEEDDDLPYKIRREGPITKVVDQEVDDRISEVSEHSGSSENSGEVYSDYYREHPDHNRTPQRGGKKGNLREQPEDDLGRPSTRSQNRNMDDSFGYSQTHKDSFTYSEQEDDTKSYRSSYYAGQNNRPGSTSTLRKGGMGRTNSRQKVMKLHRHFESSDAEFDSESTFPNSAFEGSDIDSHYRDGNHRGKILYSRDGKRMRKLQYHSDFEVNRMERGQKHRNKQKLIKMVRNEKELKGTDGIFFDIIGQYMKKGDGLKVDRKR